MIRASRATTSYRVLHWNVAGNTMHRGSTSDGLVTSIVDSIRGDGAVLVSLNELCLQQYDALISALRAAKWPADPENFARFAPTVPGRSGGPCGGKDYGIGMFSKQPLGGAARLTLPSDGGEPRKLMCAALRDRPRVRFCTTHATFVDAYRLPQLQAIFGQVDAYRANGDQVILAGDFNVSPDFGRMDRFYSSQVNTPYNRNNTGHYREVDDSDPVNCPGYGETTIEANNGGGPCGKGSKIDMIFVHEDDYVASASTGDAKPSPRSCGGAACSDHRVLIGQVALAS
ncbi:endonuclease/exonuclease/phosphatase family protein [Streptosporangium sandarakinum]|uniref:endonuclease/exonuclease/phosphatase family protein n=1 Tax=Streptosporangium sandarakinum TaxID=1260955 RepID=UPI0034281F7C